jgi:spoIIIJ-associated protein
MSAEAGEGGFELEATGETLGEAKWAALRELERHFPGLDRELVRFTVVSEGERGLLGVGHVPARVTAFVAGPPAARSAAAPPGSGEPEGTPQALVQGLLERVCSALGTPAAVEIAARGDQLVATLSGAGMGLVIGKHGQTIDAVQHLANALVARLAGPGMAVVVDAAGYRARRQASLEQTADRAAQRALATGLPVTLDPMSAVERKIVHLHLQDRPDVVTESDGAEPNRFVVVRPALDERG